MVPQFTVAFMALVSTVFRFLLSSSSSSESRRSSRQFCRRLNSAGIRLVDVFCGAVGVGVTFGCMDISGSRSFIGRLVVAHYDWFSGFCGFFCDAAIFREDATSRLLYSVGSDLPRSFIVNVCCNSAIIPPFLLLYAFSNFEPLASLRESLGYLRFYWATKICS